MADIDFDELDKAVNNLMANVDTSKRNESVDDPEDTVVMLDSAVAPEQSAKDQTPSAAESQPEPAVDPMPTPVATSPALAVKRRGQFMDVMHPSSDMKAAKPSVKREGVTLAPTTDVVAPAPVATTPVPTEESPAQTADAPELASDNDMATNQAPLTSPFLPDAKPEKRPLGGGSSDTTATPNSDIAAELQDQLPAELPQEQAASPSEPPVLPAELHTDVLAVEASESTAMDATIPQEQPDEIATAIEEQPELPVEEPIAVPAGGSIAQQYTESPSSGDQTNGSIYDTSNYHQPIEATPADKKPSPLKWIILTIVLLVLGAAAGVGYFVLTHGLPF